MSNKIIGGRIFMEKYLIEQYGVIEDKNWLKDVSDIEDYFHDAAIDEMDCGQGYYQDEAEFICKIGDKFYAVDVFAEIGSAKQDVGDRLYWIESIEKVVYREIDKPEPIARDSVKYFVEVTAQQMNELEEFMEDNHITFEKEGR